MRHIRFLPTRCAVRKSPWASSIRSGRYSAHCCAECGIPNVIIPENVMIDPELLLDLLAGERVTRIVLVPTLLRVLLEHIPDLDARVPMLKLWTLSGEYLPLDLAKDFRTALPTAALLNLYGSS